MTNERRIWDFLIDRIGNAFGAAGLMGNLYAESALKPNNLQGSYEKKLGMTDTSYTAAVDSGTYKNFAKDSAGYGLAQWTYWTRKQRLLAFAVEKGVSVGDLEMQMEFLWKELVGYSSVLKVLKSAKSVREASDMVLIGFEKPKKQDESVKTARAIYGQKYYDKFATVSSEEPGAMEGENMKKVVSDFPAGTRVVTITGDHVNARVGDSTKYGTFIRVKKGDVFEYVATSPTGWIAIRTTDRICWISNKYAKVEAV